MASRNGQALDVAHRAADLGDEHVDLGELGQAVHAALDLVGDVRDDLHGAAEVVAAALLGDDAVVDAAGGDVGVALDELVDEALVVAQVEVGLGAVLGDEDLAVLERAHGAGVDVEVGVELLDRDLEAALLSSRPREAAVMPLPSPVTTPPVTKMCLVMPPVPSWCGSRRSERSRRRTLRSQPPGNAPGARRTCTRRARDFVGPGSCPF